MGKILLTGISGNVGNAVVEYLKTKDIKLIGGVRDIERYKNKPLDIELVKLDFENSSTYKSALKNVEKVFLMRPPAITDIKGIFKPFINVCKQSGVKHIVFLSLIGIEKNPFPPHYKIEKEIVKSGLKYTFIRPSFFMQNLSSVHALDIKERNDIFIPCGSAKVSFIDTRDVGEIVGRTLIEEGHFNKAYSITGYEAINYYQVAQIMSNVLERKIKYSNPSIMKFRNCMVKRGIKKEYATVMAVLYLTTKMGMAREVNNIAEILLGRKQRSMEDFIKDYSHAWV